MNLQTPNSDPKKLDLASILYPMDPETFARDYWEKKPLHITGTPGKFQNFFSRKAFSESLLSAPGIHASFDSKNLQKLVKVFPDQVEPLFEAGATICLTGLEVTSGDYTSFAARIKSALNYTGMVSMRAYMSPDGKGFDTHFDARVATTLQIEGSKHWRISTTPGVAFPRHNALPDEHGVFKYHRRSNIEELSWEELGPPDESTFVDVILQPGDVLCLPAGTWHRAKADGYSLAINLAFDHLSTHDFFHAALHPLLSEDRAWRSPLPISFAQNPKDAELPGEVRKYLEARLDDLRSRLRAITPDTLANEWHKRTLGSIPASSVSTNREILKGDRFAITRVPTTFGFGVDSAGQKLLFLYQSDPCQRLGFDPNTLDFFQSLFESSSFSASNILEWKVAGNTPNWEDVSGLLSMLLRRGIIERVP